MSDLRSSMMLPEPVEQGSQPMTAAKDKTIAELVAALKEMLAAHSMENIGASASLRRTAAKAQAREAILKAGNAKVST